MFKDRFRMWELSKNLRDQDAIEILAEKSKRDTVGKKSEFYIGSRKIDLARAQRHLRRKKVRASTTHQDGQRRPSNSLLEAGRIRVATPPALQLRAPDDVRAPEEIIWMLREYMSGNFDNGTWIVDDETGQVMNGKWLGDRPHISHFQALYYHGCSMLEAEDESASRLLNMACDMVKELLTYQSVRLISKLLYTVLRSVQSVRRVFWNYLECLSDKIFGLFHPLPRLWKAIGRALVFSEQLGQTEMVIQVMTEQLEHRLGLSRDVITLFVDQSTLERLLSADESGYLRTERILHKLIAKIQSLHKEETLVMAEIQRTHYLLALNLYYWGKEAQVRDKLQQLLKSEYFEPYHRFECSRLIGWLEYGLGRWTEAEDALNDALQLAEGTWGYIDPNAVGIITDLLDVLREAEHWDRYNQLQKDYMARISALEAHRNIEWGRGLGETVVEA